MRLSGSGSEERDFEGWSGQFDALEGLLRVWVVGGCGLDGCFRGEEDEGCGWRREWAFSRANPRGGDLEHVQFGRWRG